MVRPALKPYLNVYRRVDEDGLFIGLGPEKIVIDSPTPEMVEFVTALDGSLTREQLGSRFSDSDEWLTVLSDMGVLEDAEEAESARAEMRPRFARQVDYLRLFERPGWSGFEAQKRLEDARVVVCGAGAGGSSVIALLASAGVGTIEAIDFDVFEQSNLATHPIIEAGDVGVCKVDAMARHVALRDDRVEYRGRCERIGSPEQLAELVADADFFVPAFDHPRGLATRWANEAGLATGVPFGVIGATDKGAAAGPVVVPGESACLECVGMTDATWLREPAGQALIGTTVIMLAGIIVGEIVKLITGSAPCSLIGRNIYIDTGSLVVSETDYEPRPHCACGAHGRAAQAHQPSASESIGASNVLAADASSAANAPASRSAV